MQKRLPLDIVAGALVAFILFVPLTAGMLASRHASEETKAKILAPVDPMQNKRNQKAEQGA